MKLWVVAAFGVLIVAGSLLYYVMNSPEAEGSNVFWLVNTIGLITVVLGIVSAGLILRRTSRPS